MLSIAKNLDVKMWMSVGVLALNRRCTFWQPRSRVETITAADILIRTEPGRNNSAASDPESGMAWEEERRVIIVGVAWADQLTREQRWATVQQQTKPYFNDDTTSHRVLYKLWSTLNMIWESWVYHCSYCLSWPINKRTGEDGWEN